MARVLGACRNQRSIGDPVSRRVQTYTAEDLQRHLREHKGLNVRLEEIPLFVVASGLGEPLTTWRDADGFDHIAEVIDQ